MYPDQTEYIDKTLTCVCGKEFDFTAGEQQFYAEKGYSEPKRCTNCRAKKKQEREANGLEA